MLILFKSTVLATDTQSHIMTELRIGSPAGSNYKAVPKSNSDHNGKVKLPSGMEVAVTGKDDMSKVSAT